MTAVEIAMSFFLRFTCAMVLPGAAPAKRRPRHVKLIEIFDYLFLGSDSPTCLESADTNNDATIDISDGIATLQYLFNGGPPPAAPGPPEAPCGSDVDEPGSAGDLGCEAYPPCG